MLEFIVSYVAWFFGSTALAAVIAITGFNVWLISLSGQPEFPPRAPVKFHYPQITPVNRSK